MYLLSSKLFELKPARDASIATVTRPRSCCGLVGDTRSKRCSLRGSLACRGQRLRGRVTGGQVRCAWHVSAHRRRCGRSARPTSRHKAPHTTRGSWGRLLLIIARVSAGTRQGRTAVAVTAVEKRCTLLHREEQSAPRQARQSEACDRPLPSLLQRKVTRVSIFAAARCQASQF